MPRPKPNRAPLHADRSRPGDGVQKEPSRHPGCHPNLAGFQHDVSPAAEAGVLALCPRRLQQHPFALLVADPQQVPDKEIAERSMPTPARRLQPADFPIAPNVNQFPIESLSYGHQRPQVICEVVGQARVKATGRLTAAFRPRRRYRTVANRNWNKSAWCCTRLPGWRPHECSIAR